VEKELFEAALGICEPLYIREVVFDMERQELRLHIDFSKGGRFSCPVCGAEELPVHDTADKTWRHLDFFQYKCYIHMRTPRVDCPQCGKKLWTPPWSRKGSGFTLLFEAFVMSLAKAMPMLQIADLVGETDTRLWRVVCGYVKRAYEKKPFASVSRIGIDETSSRKGHNYVTIFADMDSRQILFATEGKDSGTVGRFAAEMLAHGASASQIREATIDMSPAFIAGVEAHLPEAGVTYDKFHVIQTLNRAQDEVRRMEQKKNPLLKRSRYVWLKNPENLSKGQREQLETLSRANTKTAKVYQMKLTFQDIYRCVADPAEAREAIMKWLSWAVRSRIKPVRAFAKTVKEHLDGILRYFETRLTSGAMEGINSRVQTIKRRARGFRNIDNFIAMIYLEAGGLDLGLPT
jgi:transposase